VPAAAAPAPVQHAAETPAPEPVATPVVAPQPVATAPQHPVTPLPHRSTPLHRAPHAVAQLLQVATERGISRARLQLRPADLGGIEIRLQSSSAGVTAQVVADSPEAAKLLAQAADDLRRSLERHDVTLLQLDVSTAGDDRFQSAGHSAAEVAAHAPRGAAEADADIASDDPSPETTVQLPSGLLVDVLA
jgi:flagellar hook-length control protein FliK